MTVKISSRQISGIGRIIHFHRKQSGLSRVDLADIAGVGKTVIFDIEHGKESVRLNTLIRVAEALNISLYLNSPLMAEFEKENTHAQS
ncbi:MAG: helix-turn-helix domain-containing protein [Desulfococcaceae bacterium]